MFKTCLKFLATINPISSKKNASMPLNKSIEKGAIILSPVDPAKRPTIIAPIKSNCAPSVKDLCNKFNELPFLFDFAAFAKKTARIIAGDSINAMAAAI